MSSFRFRELKTEFKRLDPEEQRRLFALSSFQSDHVEAGLPVHIAKVERELKKALRGVYGDSTWRTIENRGDVDAVLSSFEQGDAVNYMLSWYLEDEYPRYSCEPESNSNNSEFDVTVLDQGVALCGIEIKRAGSSNRIYRYLEDHRDKCEGPRSARNFLLVNLYPISDKMDPIRTADLVFGYGPLSARVHEFYERDNSYVANVPAPLFRNESDYDPLEEIRNVLEIDLGIRR